MIFVLAVAPVAAATTAAVIWVKVVAMVVEMVVEMVIEAVTRVANVGSPPNHRLQATPQVTRYA